jgi:aspartokinase/homoserine dehydrogenase 1
MNVCLLETSDETTMSTTTLAYLPAADRVLATRVDLVLIGARGQVGSALRRRLAQQQATLKRDLGLDLVLLAGLDRRGFAFDLQGLAPDRIESHLQPRETADLEHLLAHLVRPGSAPALVIDCSASEEITDLYPRLLAGGVGVVTANKRGNARALTFYRELQRLSRQHAAPYRYETTAGAAIPVLGPLRDLRQRGERVTSIRGVLSGSLSYILARVQDDALAFSTAVMEAGALGYTEPDPSEDLCLRDVTRKLLGLAREAGFELDADAIEVEPLADDGHWRERVRAARARGERWVVLAEADDLGGRIGLRALPLASPFASLRPGQNLVQVTTDLQREVPLSLAGPGAGPEVTAAGVFSDVLAAARQLARR